MAASNEHVEGSMQGVVVNIVDNGVGVGDGGVLTRPRVGIRERVEAARGSAYDSDNTDFLASTEVDCESFSMEWNLCTYSLLSRYEKIDSPLFVGGPKNNHTWQLRVYPKNKLESEADDVEHLAVHLVLKEIGNSYNYNVIIRPIRARCQIAILNADYTPFKVFGDPGMPVMLFDKNSTYSWDKIIPSRELICPSPPMRLLEKDTLRIQCTIWIEEKLKHSISTGSVQSYLPTKEERAARSKWRLVEDFGNLYKKFVNADFEMWIGMEKIKVHKAVLAARSPVFSKMFTQGVLVNENKMVITDFDVATVKAMLEYIYTGNVDKAIIFGCAPDLLQIGEKFELPELKEMCEDIISDNIIASNATTLLVLGHTFNAPVLKARAIDFINRHKEEVTKTDDFKQAVRNHSHTNVFVELYMS